MSALGNSSKWFVGLGCATRRSLGLLPVTMIVASCQQSPPPRHTYVDVFLELAGAPLDSPDTHVHKLDNGGASIEKDGVQFQIIGGGVVVLFRDTRSAQRSPSESGPLYTERDVRKVARVILGQVGVHDKLEVGRISLPPPVSDATPAPIASVILESKIGGYASPGAGNYVVMQFNARTGRLSAFERSTGWRYSKPRVKVGREEAGDKACRSIGAKPSDFVSAVLSFVEPAATASPTATKFAAKRECRLAYRVITRKGTVNIDAETGEPLGGNALKAHD